METFFLILLSLTSILLNHAFPTSKTRNIKIKPLIANPYANTIQIYAVKPRSSCRSTSTAEKVPADMKVKEIKEELRTLHVSYADCFERDSLVKRLIDARNNKQPTSTNLVPEEEDITITSGKNNAKESEISFDRSNVHQALRALRVSELRTQLAERGIRWGSMIEKEDLVLALLHAMEETAYFSSSGALSPGYVKDVSDEELFKELNSPTSATPLLLDVYATWCGPCKFLQPQLDTAAKELGSKIRMAKLDSGKYSALASSLHVEGFPSMILFDKGGKEIGRKEGTLMKDDLIRWIEEEVLLLKT